MRNKINDTLGNNDIYRYFSTSSRIENRIVLSSHQYGRH